MAEMDYSISSPFSWREGEFLKNHPEVTDLAVGEATMAREYIVTSAVPTNSGFLRLGYFTAKKSETVTAVRYTVGSVVAGATPTVCRIGLYEVADNGNLTLVASTPNDTALFSGGTFAAFTKALSVPYNKIQGRLYALGVLIVTAAATPNLYGTNSHIASVAFQDPKLCAQVGGQTDLPSSVSAGSLGATSSVYYLEIIP